MINLFENKKTMVALSIAVALLLWIFVVTKENPKIFIPINDIPVELTNVESLEEKGLIISNPQDYTISIRVYGKKNQVYKINKNAIRVEADLSRLNTKGTHFLPISIFGIPPEIEISSKNPDAIEIVLDQIVTKERDIKIKIIGQPAEGMAYLSYIANPSKVTLEGAETLLNMVSEVVAELDITNASSEINKQLPLKAVDANGKEVGGVSISPKNVDVTIPIGATKNVPVNPKLTGSLPQDSLITSVTVNPTEIKIGGISQNFNDISRISTEEISLTGQTKTFEKKVKLLLPEGVEVISGEAAVMVKVTIEPLIEKTFETTDIKVNNLKGDLTIGENNLDQTISYTLKGGKSQIDGLKKENLTLFIDVSDLPEGRHDLPVKIDLPEGITLESINPKVVRINIQRKIEEEVVE